MLKILLVHPRFPTSYWGFQDAIRLVNKRATLPPLGLITLAACLPREWELRLVDLNVGDLGDDDLLWADAVFIGGMLIQIDSITEVTRRAHLLGRPVVVGGPTATTSPEVFPQADVIFQGEVEGRIDALVAAVKSLPDRRLGARVVIEAVDAKPDLKQAPVPRFDLLDIVQYNSLSIQYSRGCPFSCEFCDVIEIFGRSSRVKTAKQILAEIAAIHRLGFVGSIFLVDDNFIGNRREARKLLPAITAWQEAHGRPFDFYTEASINLASDPGLMKSMVAAGFRSVFVGLETPSKDALREAGKTQNLAVDLHQAVETMTRAGLEVMGGFIVGFDRDGPEIFAAQREFIQASPIPLSMVGMLIALPGTALWRRLKAEGRLRTRRPSSGDQFSRANFEPGMNEETLLRGYRDLLADLYTPEAFYQRCAAYVDLVREIPPSGKAGLTDIKYFLMTVVQVGILSPRRRHFWKLLRRARSAAPHVFKWAVVKALQGEHMIRYTEEHVIPHLDRAIAEVAIERQLAERTVQPPLPATMPDPPWPLASPEPRTPRSQSPARACHPEIGR